MFHSLTDAAHSFFRNYILYHIIVNVLNWVASSHCLSFSLYLLFLSLFLLSVSLFSFFLFFFSYLSVYLSSLYFLFLCFSVFINLALFSRYAEMFHAAAFICVSFSLVMFGGISYLSQNTAAQLGGFKYFPHRCFKP